MSKTELIKKFCEIYKARLGKNDLNDEELQSIIMHLSYLEVSQSWEQGRSVDETDVFFEYVKSGMSSYPQMSNLTGAFHGYMATLQWNGLRDYLRDYFFSKFGVKIDNVEFERVTFFSSNHKRFEDGILVSEDLADRIIELSFSENKQKCLVRISPTLSDKNSKLLKIIGNTFIFVGINSDYKFEITFDDFDSIENFSLELVNRKVRIQYFE